MPLVPTTDRDFTTSSQIRTFVRVYEGGRSPLAPVPMTVSILDEKNETVFSSTASLPVARFTADRAADFRFDLPLTTLHAGSYVLAFTAALGKESATRSLIFRVGAK